MGPMEREVTLNKVQEEGKGCSGAKHRRSSRPLTHYHPGRRHSFIFLYRPSSDTLYVGSESTDSCGPSKRRAWEGWDTGIAAHHGTRTIKLAGDGRGRASFTQTREPGGRILPPSACSPCIKQAVPDAVNLLPGASERADDKAGDLLLLLLSRPCALSY